MGSYELNTTAELEQRLRWLENAAADHAYAIKHGLPSGAAATRVERMARQASAWGATPEQVAERIAAGGKEYASGS